MKRALQNAEWSLCYFSPFVLGLQDSLVRICIQHMQLLMSDTDPQNKGHRTEK